MGERLLSVFTFHFFSQSEIRSALSTSAYKIFFKSIDESIATKMSFKKAQEYELSTDVMSLAEVLTRTLSRKKKLLCHTLLLEFFDKYTDVEVYDDICEAIEVSLRKKETVQPWCIGIAVSQNDVFKESVLLNKRLLPLGSVKFFV